jgi:hypothetical protein
MSEPETWICGQPATRRIKVKDLMTHPDDPDCIETVYVCAAHRGTVVTDQFVDVMVDAPVRLSDAGSRCAREA